MIYIDTSSLLKLVITDRLSAFVGFSRRGFEGRETTKLVFLTARYEKGAGGVRRPLAPWTPHGSQGAFSRSLAESTAATLE